MYTKDLKKFVCSKKIFPLDYNDKTFKAIKAITTPKYDFLLFGSSAYKYLNLASDIDILQYVPADKFKESLYIIIKQLINKNFIIGDIKIGIKCYLRGLYDNLGFINNGVIKGYNPINIKRIVEKYKINISKIPNINEVNYENWMYLGEQIHEIIALRFTVEDVKRGYTLSDGIKYNIDDLILECQDLNLNKIDGYYILNNRIIEITNILQISNKNSEDVLYNISLNMLKFLQPKFLNLNKALKRAYVLSRINNNENLLKKIYHYLIGKINYGSSLLVDFKVLNDILKVNKISNIKKEIIKHLLNLINRFKLFDLLPIENYINDINLLINNINNEEYFKQILKYLIIKLNNEINNLTLDYMKNNNIKLIYLLP